MDAHKTLVSQTVWRWREATEPKSTTNAAFRRRGLLHAAIPCTIAAFLFWRRHTIAGVLLCVMSGVVLALVMVYPAAFRAIEKGAQKFGEWVAAGVAWVVLMPFYYTCFVLGRCIIILTGKDPMTRRFPAFAGTLWHSHAAVADPAQYRKQF